MNIKDTIRAAGGVVHSDSNIFFTTVEQFLEAASAAPLTWIDSWAATHTMSRLRAQEVLKELFDRWPDGFDEIESALRKMPDEVERLRGLAATCYAGLGAECNLPEPWLDVLNAAANGDPFDTEGLLPFIATDSPAAQAHNDAIRAAMAAIAETESRKQALEIMEGMLKP
jgi:hypothetical protein